MSNFQLLKRQFFLMNFSFLQLFRFGRVGTCSLAVGSGEEGTWKNFGFHHDGSIWCDNTGGSTKSLCEWGRSGAKRVNWSSRWWLKQRKLPGFSEIWETWYFQWDIYFFFDFYFWVSSWKDAASLKKETVMMMMIIITIIFFQVIVVGFRQRCLYLSCNNEKPGDFAFW